MAQLRNKKHITAWAFASMLFLMKVHAQAIPDWENPQVIGIHKEAYRSSLMLQSIKSRCKEFTTLNGCWKFKWSPNPEVRPIEFYKEGYDVSTWDNIHVPGNWQTQGFGTPIYTNINYPFKRDQPRVTSEPPESWTSYKNRNPVGSYVTTFYVEPGKTDKQFYLIFEGVESAMYVWVNGQLIGYSENSYSPAEFDATQYIREGKNRLAVEVYRWCDGSYLENQDFWRLSGIFRPVELWERPKTHIRDYHIIAEPSNDFSSATVGAQVFIRNLYKKEKSKLQLEVIISGNDKSGKNIEKTIVQSVPSIAAFGSQEILLKDVLDNPRLWSADDPYLYTISLTLREKKKILEHFQYHLGVRKIEVNGEILKLNGKAIKLKGVNRHDHHPRTGRYVDGKTTELDVQRIKQGNFNMVRTAHYPHSSLFYELCDRYGIYVMIDANQESHGYGIGNTELGDNPNWTKAHIDRALSMFHRDKNNPSIVFWSLGNEGGRGRNLKAMRDTIRKLDSSRLIYSDSDRSVSDVYDDGYLPPEKLKALAEKISDRPVMLREYAHAMGNSLGNFQEYWNVIEADQSIAGAAIWDLVDQSIAKKIDGSPLNPGNNPQSVYLKSDEFWAYGGDFGDRPNDGSFLINGLLGADRIPHPHYYEAQKVQQYIDFDLIAGTFNVQVISKLDFTSLNDFDYAYEFLDNGKVIKAAGQSLNANDILEIPTTVEAKGELILNIYAKLPEPTLWAEKGFIVARKQFVLKPYDFSKSLRKTINPVCKETSTAIVISAGETTFVIDKISGSLKSWQVNHEEILKGELEPYFWKPANENQRRNGYNSRLGSWRNAANNRRVIGYNIVDNQEFIVVSFDMGLPVGATYQVKYTFNGAGKVQVEANYIPTAQEIDQMPKFGMRMRLPATMNTIEWYGRGAFENYPDRKSGALIGYYKMTLEDFITPYVVPQDNANRCDVRWFSINNASGKKMTISGLQPLCFRIWPYSEEDIEQAQHNYQLPRRDYININIDLNIIGVGGNDSWGARTLKQYTIDGNKSYSYGFVMDLAK